MPRSKRAKKPNLTKKAKSDNKKERPAKNDFIEKVRNTIDKYERLFILNIHNIRTQKVSELRLEMQGSKLMFGKNKLMFIAFGRTESEEYCDGLHKAVKYLKGPRTIFFTNHSEEETLSQLTRFRDIQYARGGSIATQTVTLAAGPLPRFSHSMEPQLRILGLPVKLQRGIIHLEQDFPVCKQGDVLTPEQCRILTHFEVQLSEFKITPIAMWEKDGGWTEYDDSTTSNQGGILNANEVRIQCKLLDDGKYYFIPCD